MALNVSAGLAPTGGGSWETHDAQYGKGGWRAVADNTARDAIPTLRRSEGMFVYNIATGVTYRLGAGLGNGDWVAQSSGVIAAGNGLTGATTFAVLANGASIEVSASGIRRAALTGSISSAAGSNTTAFASGDFGALDVLTTGFVGLGATRAATGTIRAGSSFTFNALDNTGLADATVLSWVGSSNIARVGGTNVSRVELRCGSNAVLECRATYVQIYDALPLQFEEGGEVNAVTNSAAASTGFAMTFRAGHASGAGGTGATCTVSGGNATGPSGTRVGGNLNLIWGTGASGSGNTSIGVACSNYQSMVGGTFIANGTTIPSGNPTGGGFLYVEAGALKWRGSGGTVTTLGAA